MSARARQVAESAQSSFLTIGYASFDEWCAAGVALSASASKLCWEIGDWWAYGQHHYGDRAKAAAEGIFGRAFQTLKNYGTVARAFETSRRRDVLSFAHHAEVAALPAPEADALLALAEAKCLSKRELRLYRFRGDHSIEHYTPRHVIEAARNALGHIELDPASCAKAQEIVLADRFCTAPRL